MLTCEIAELQCCVGCARKSRCCRVCCCLGVSAGRALRCVTLRADALRLLGWFRGLCQQEEFQAERSEFLDTIRELQQELKRKQLIIDNFIPPEEVERVESRARWDDEKAVWVLPRLEISGNNIRGRRPVVDAITRAPESEYARRRGAYDTNPRYKSENVAGLEAEPAERSTLDYNGTMASRRVADAMNAALGGDEEDEMLIAADGLPAERKKKDRPRTASRRKREDGMSAGGAGSDMSAAAYPSARGLVGRA